MHGTLPSPAARWRATLPSPSAAFGSWGPWSASWLHPLAPAVAVAGCSRNSCSYYMLLQYFQPDLQPWIPWTSQKKHRKKMQETEEIRRKNINPKNFEINPESYLIFIPKQSMSLAGRRCRISSTSSSFLSAHAVRSLWTSLGSVG